MFDSSMQPSLTIANAPEATGGVKVALETSKVATWKYVEGAVSPISGFRAVRSEESCCEFHRIASRGLRAGSAEWHSSWTIPIPLTRPGSGQQGSRGRRDGVAERPSDEGCTLFRSQCPCGRGCQLSVMAVRLSAEDNTYMVCGNYLTFRIPSWGEVCE